MRNHYEASEVIELGNAHDEILSQKEIGGLDSFGVPYRDDTPTLDDLDE